MSQRILSRVGIRAAHLFSSQVLTSSDTRFAPALNRKSQSPGTGLMAHRAAPKSSVGARCAGAVDCTGSAVDLYLVGALEGNAHGG